MIVYHTMPMTPERKREYMYEYYRKNKDKRSSYNKLYWERTKDLPEAKLKREQWYARNKARVKENNRAWRLRTFFGIDQQQYENILENQGGKCAICKQTNRRKTSHLPLAIDHDHVNGRLRGLLCNRCNLCLGWFEDHQDVISIYLRRIDGSH